MIHSPRFTAILDACVLYPAPIRDFLLNLAEQELFKPVWTEKIHEEWIDNLLIKRTDLKKPNLAKTVQSMNLAFPDANVVNFEELIESLKLPDPDDRHVLAAAIRIHADVIVTFNLRDFPGKALKPYNVDVQHPDSFIVNLILLNEKKVATAFQNQVAKLANPPLSAEYVLSKLEAGGLVKTAKEIRRLL